MNFLIVGAGFSGAVIGHALADAGNDITMIDSRAHIGGNCHSERDPDTGVMVHSYGPHIFHTDDREVWAYVNQFANFQPYKHRVKTTVGKQVYSLPVNLRTINQFFGTDMREAEAREFISNEQADTSIVDPQSFEEQALRCVGPALYEAFFKGYTEKQWGVTPTALPASIFKRLPLRFSNDDNYFSSTHQGIPQDGYTDLIEKILDHKLITVHLETPYSADLAAAYDHVVWSGALDGYFDFELGRLGYRTLDFERFLAEGDYQGCAVMNYGDRDVPYTRITEHKHFSPWESHEGSVLYREFSREAEPGDIPYYPIRLVDEKDMLAAYVAKAEATEGVTFVGRLGTYRYLDMDVTIREALDTAGMILEAIDAQKPLPAFAVSPL